MRFLIVSCVLFAGAAWAATDETELLSQSTPKGGKLGGAGPTRSPVVRTPSISPGRQPSRPTGPKVSGVQKPKSPTTSKPSVTLPPPLKKGGPTVTAPTGPQATKPGVLKSGPNVKKGADPQKKPGDIKGGPTVKKGADGQKKPGVTLPPSTKKKGPGAGPGTFGGTKGADLPRPPKDGFKKPPFVPAGKSKIGKDFNKNLHGAIIKPPKGIQIVDVKRHHVPAVQIRSHMAARYFDRPWFAQNWRPRPVFGFPQWHVWHHHHHQPWWWWWQPMSWTIWTNWAVGTWGQPFYYDYGSNVVTINNTVYVNEVPVASAPVYADQAIQLSRVEAPPPDQKIEWKSLGVFTLATSRDERDPNIVLQLAVSPDGLLSGTSYNRATDTTVPIQGRVDPDTQRAAIRLSEEDDTTLETGIYNLTQDQTPVLVHFGTLRSQTWFLVRLDSPAKE